MWTHVAQHPVLLPWCAVIGASLVAAVIDVRVRRIPNWLTLPLFLAGLVWAGWSGGTSGILEGLAAALLLALPYLILFAIAGGGAADAKLMGALGAWLGLSTGWTVLVAVCISGALLGIGYALIKNQGRLVLCNMIVIGLALMSLVSGRRKWSDISQSLPDPGNMLTIPYGLATFVGVSIVGLGVYLRKG
jgi:prepilin peptidase CpaA